MSDIKMTEIEQIKNKVELILNDDSGGSRNKNHDIYYYAKLNLAKLELLEEDIPILINTIESLQTEVKKYKWEDEQFNWLQEQIKTCSSENTELKSHIESLQAENKQYETTVTHQQEAFKDQGKEILQYRRELESQKEEIERLRFGITTAIGIWEAMDSEDDAGNVMDKVIETFYVARGYFLSKEGAN